MRGTVKQFNFILIHKDTWTADEKVSNLSREPILEIVQAMKTTTFLLLCIGTALLHQGWAADECRLEIPYPECCVDGLPALSCVGYENNVIPGVSTTTTKPTTPSPTSSSSPSSSLTMTSANVTSVSTTTTKPTTPSPSSSVTTSANVAVILTSSFLAAMLYRR
ncbi:hypothetical protein B566_EDAN007743 [Ephemera danica]|nr:hypothetical protein B566_EDAN007743 [Ephemera danica]